MHAFSLIVLAIAALIGGLVVAFPGLGEGSDVPVIALGIAVVFGGAGVLARLIVPYLLESGRREVRNRKEARL